LKNFKDFFWTIASVFTADSQIFFCKLYLSDFFVKLTLRKSANMLHIICDLRLK
jgi:hypothetical protein